MSRKRRIGKWFDMLKKRRYDELMSDDFQAFTSYTVVNGEGYRNLVEDQYVSYDEADQNQETHLKS